MYYNARYKNCYAVVNSIPTNTNIISGARLIFVFVLQSAKLSKWIARKRKKATLLNLGK